MTQATAPRRLGVVAAMLLVAMSAALAGCTSDEAPQSVADPKATPSGTPTKAPAAQPPATPQAPAGNETGNATEVIVKRLEGTQDVSLTLARIVAVTSHAGANCFMVDANDATFLSAHVEAAWSAQSPLTEELELFVGQKGQRAFNSVRGTSPLAIDVTTQDFLDAEVDTFKVFTHIPSGAVGAAAQQSVTVTFSIEYGLPTADGADPVVDPGWSCS